MKRKTIYKIIIILIIAFITSVHFITDSDYYALHQFYKALYFMPIILGAVIFGFKGGTATALLISIIYSPQKLLSLGTLQGEAFNELLDVFLFVAVGIVTGILVEKRNIAITTLESQLNKYKILENYTNSVFESIRLGIIAINNDCFITSMNQGAKTILGLKHDCIGVNFVEAFSCCEDVEEIIMKALNDNAPMVNLERNLQKNQNEVNIKMDIYPLGYDHKNKGVVIIIEDITEIKIIKNQVHRNDKLASVGQLATGIAHEIRNPLAIIKMIEQTISKEMENDDEILAELKIIDEEVERANKVIKSLMEFSKPSKNEKAEYSINQIIEDVLVITNKYTSQHKVNVRFIKNDVPFGYFNREQIIQAFVNLIFNSVDAMPAGGEIIITTRPIKENKIFISFSDTGQGIEEDNLNIIFDPFFTTKADGTGLGLPILHRIIQDHEGTINVKSVLGKGTTFEIII